MSYTDGLAAMNLQMPARIPRTEFDAQMHWELVKHVTGVDVNYQSARELREQASEAFTRAWNYDIFLSGTIYWEIFNGFCTNMGHAEYLDGGTDFDDAIRCPFSNPEQVLAFDPWEQFGEQEKTLIKQRFEMHYHSMLEHYPTMVNTAGTYVTHISGAISLFGWEMLLEAAGLDPDGFGEVMNRYSCWFRQYYEALAETSVPVVYSHDDIVWTAGAFIHPEWYRRYVFPNLKKLYEPLIEAGKKIIFVSDGNYTQFVDDIAATGVHGFFFEPLTDLHYVAEKYGKTHVIIGNVDTRILLMGTKVQIRAEVERCLSIGRHCPGYFIGVTNMIPANTPVENALYYNEVYEELCRR